MNRFPLLLLLLCVPMLLHAQGKLTAYYANCDFGDYSKGQLIVDTNDPFNRMVDYSETEFKYEGDDSGGYYSSLILKSNVTVKEYQMSPLPVGLVKDRATFVSHDGDVVTIFAANINGHQFYSYTDDGEFRMYYDVTQTETHQQYYAIRYVFKNEYYPEGCFFEEPLEVEEGDIKLYVLGCNLDYCSCDDPENVRYRPYLMGFLQEKWTPVEDYGYDLPAYDENGNLLTDVAEIVDIPSIYSIAYIGAEDALYIGGKMHYRQQ